MTETRILELYRGLFGDFEESTGYRLSVRRSATDNWVVERFYRRSSWVSEKFEHRAVFSKDGELIEPQQWELDKRRKP